MKAIQHLKTIHHHRRLVLGGCFRVGLYWQGLTHDLSKYSLTEFRQGAKYYLGTKSPNGAERAAKGYSEAWMHHKGRNRHHYEYWTDWDPENKVYRPIPMPRKYLAESIMDRRAACMTYEGKDYRPDSALRYFRRSPESRLLHPQTHRELEYLLTMLAEQGEAATFRYIRHSVLTGTPFPWEENAHE